MHARMSCKHPASEKDVYKSGVVHISNCIKHMNLIHTTCDTILYYKHNTFNNKYTLVS